LQKMPQSFVDVLLQQTVSQQEQTYGKYRQHFTHTILQKLQVLRSIVWGYSILNYMLISHTNGQFGQKFIYPSSKV
jgi:hypothetical protein